MESPAQSVIKVNPINKLILTRGVGLMSDTILLAGDFFIFNHLPFIELVGHRYLACPISQNKNNEFPKQR